MFPVRRSGEKKLGESSYFSADFAQDSQFRDELDQQTELNRMQIFGCFYFLKDQN